MSGKSRRDYCAVLQAIENLLADSMCLNSVVIDFECALWQAVANVFPNASIQGSVFHWTQAIWQKVEGLGLSTAYHEDDATHKYIQPACSQASHYHIHSCDVCVSVRHRAITEVRSTSDNMAIFCYRTIHVHILRKV
jgi:hypothetical protein